MVVKLKESERATVALALANIFIARFSELDQIKWRINYSVWAAICAVGYLWIEHADLLDARIVQPAALLALSVGVCAGHTLAVIWIRNQSGEMSSLRNKCELVAAGIADIDLHIPDQVWKNGSIIRMGPPRPIRDWLRHWRWVAWEVAVSVALCFAVGSLVTGQGRELAKSTTLSKVVASPKRTP